MSGPDRYERVMEMGTALIRRYRIEQALGIYPAAYVNPNGHYETFLVEADAILGYMLEQFPEMPEVVPFKTMLAGTYPISLEDGLSKLPLVPAELVPPFVLRVFTQDARLPLHMSRMNNLNALTKRYLALIMATSP